MRGHLCMECEIAASQPPDRGERSVKLPLSVIVPARNEEQNLGRCLRSLRDVGEVYVVDSFSSDRTLEIARRHGASVVQFQYRGGWPKKRQWAMDTLPLAFDWILLLDADECLTPDLADEISSAIRNPAVDGYFIGLQMIFLGRSLRHCGARFEKLCLFRKHSGAFECRFEEQDNSMCDIEVHEHVKVKGRVATLRNCLLHDNTASFDRYLAKHNEYSNWEAALWKNGKPAGGIAPRFFGTQAQRRRWLKNKFLMLPGSPLFLFFYRYCFRLGFMDGRPGLIYCAMQGIQLFHTKAKIYEMGREATPDGKSC